MKRNAPNSQELDSDHPFPFCGVASSRRRFLARSVLAAAGLVAGSSGCSHLKKQQGGSARVAFVTANLVARVSGYRFELAHWGEQHKKTVAATDAAAWRSICREIAATGFGAVGIREAHAAPEVLPEVRSSSEIYGETAPGVFETPIRLAGVAGDQQAALFGQNCFHRGLAKNTYGTGCFMLMNIGREPAPSRHQLLTTVGWKVNGQTDYALEGSVFVGGAVVQWRRDGLGLIKSSAEVEALASSVPDSGGVYLVAAFAGLGAPHWDQYARGTITGLTRGSTAAHLARAALEGIAFQVVDVLDVMKADSGIGLNELRVDGGAAANNLLMQFQADILSNQISPRR